LEAVDSGQLRFQKICQLILKSPYGIHDLSRIELDPSSQLPRFNMALELGFFLGANLLSEKAVLGNGHRTVSIPTVLFGP
jgi:hypothetical protein